MFLKSTSSYAIKIDCSRKSVCLIRRGYTGFGRRHLIEKNAEGGKHFLAAPLEFIDAFLSIGAIRQLFRWNHLVTARGVSDHLELALRQVEMDPVARADRGESSSV